jgi:outer membrane protein assembly factor BamB
VTALAGCSTLGLPAEPESGPTGTPDPTGPTATFRGGPARRGFYPDREAPTEPTVEWEHTLNTGDHTAAKASVVPLRPGTEADDAVVTAGDTGTLSAFDGDGTVLWETDLTDAQRGIHGTPTVAGDTVYVGAYDGVLYAVDRETGESRFEVQLGDAIGSSPIYYDGSVYVAVEYIPADGSLFVVDARTGRVEADLAAPDDHPHSTCALAPAADRVVVGANDGTLYAWRLSDHAPAWEFDTGDAIKGPVAVHDGAAFVGSWDDYLYRVDLGDGTADWEYETGYRVMSGPGIDPRRGTVYVGSQDDHLHAVDADSGTARWRYDADGWITGCPSVVGECVLVGSYDRCLHALDPAGEPVWTLDLAGEVTASARPVDGRVYVAERALDEPGRLYAVS